MCVGSWFTGQVSPRLSHFEFGGGGWGGGDKYLLEVLNSVNLKHKFSAIKFVNGLHHNYLHHLHSVLIHKH